MQLNEKAREWDKLIVVSDYLSPPRAQGAYFPLDIITSHLDMSYENAVRAGSLVPRHETHAVVVEYRGGGAEMAGAVWVVDTKNNLADAIEKTANILVQHLPLEDDAARLGSWIRYVRVSESNGCLQLTVLFGPQGQHVPGVLVSGHSAVIRSRVSANVDYEFAAYAAYDLGLHLYIDYRQEWKKTTELIKIGTTMAVLGSQYMKYREHSRTGLRPVGSYSGKDDRVNMQRHLHQWGLLADMDRIADRPLVTDWLPGSDVPVAFLRGMCFSYDSKAHQAIAATGSAMSKNPVPSSTVAMTAWQVQGADRTDLLGEQVVDLWLDGPLGGSRSIGMRAEVCSAAQRGAHDLKYIFALDTVSREVPEIVARLKQVAGGAEYLPKESFFPAVLEEADVLSKLGNYELLDEYDATCESAGQKYYTIDTSLSNSKLSKAIGVALEDLVPTLMLAVKRTEWGYVQAATCELLHPPVDMSTTVRFTANALAVLISGTHHALGKFTALAQQDYLGVASPPEPVLSFSARVDVQDAARWFCGQVEDGLEPTPQCTATATAALRLTWLAPSVAARSVNAVCDWAQRAVRRLADVQLTHSQLDLIAFGKALSATAEVLEARDSGSESVDSQSRAATMISDALTNVRLVFGIRPGYSIVDEAAVVITSVLDLKGSVNLQSMPDDSPVAKTIADVFAAADLAETALSKSKTHVQTRKAVKALYLGLARLTTKEKMAECAVHSGTHSTGYNWNIEHQQFPFTLEMLDELHAGLRTGAGFIDKMSALAFALDKLAGRRNADLRAAYMRDVIRRANVEFKPPAYSKSKQKVSKQCYGNDLEDFFTGKCFRGRKGELSPCAVKEFPEPYKSALAASCSLLHFIYVAYKSPNPAEEFGVPIDDVITELEAATDKWVALNWCVPEHQHDALIASAPRRCCF